MSSFMPSREDGAWRIGDVAEGCVLYESIMPKEFNELPLVMSLPILSRDSKFFITFWSLLSILSNEKAELGIALCVKLESVKSTELLSALMLARR